MPWPYTLYFSYVLNDRNLNESNIIIEVIRPVLNSFFFNDKISQVQKGTKKH